MDEPDFWEGEGMKVRIQPFTVDIDLEAYKTEFGLSDHREVRADVQRQVQDALSSWLTDRGLDTSSPETGAVTDWFRATRGKHSATPRHEVTKRLGDAYNEYMSDSLTTEWLAHIERAAFTAEFTLRHNGDIEGDIPDSLLEAIEAVDFDALAHEFHIKTGTKW
ncbi:hypothetical protein AB0G00_24035 [Nocardia salmonicida]|uniref:hypothetical protein n=1 Tax=Nocardia salmonicida TaxID=53431 RepID=UPI003407F536